jgi:hypothetical protein
MNDKRAKWKIKELNEWYLYGFDTVKIKIKIKLSKISSKFERIQW